MSVLHDPFFIMLQNYYGTVLNYPQVKIPSFKKFVLISSRDQIHPINL